jgi:GNAT superfamily N-acetyltransferase
MDVITTAWHAAGEPHPARPRSYGRCARCARHAGLATVSDVVSGTFTGWDGWDDPAGPGLCPACAWAYRHPPLRLCATCVTASPAAMSHPALAEVATMLQEALAPDVALAVPLRPGRKHVLPAAAWGRVTTGETCLPWTRADAARLAVMARLRGQGFGSRMLAAPAPAFGVLRRLTPDRWPQVTRDWEALRPWRERRPWLDLALRLPAPAAGPA